MLTRRVLVLLVAVSAIFLLAGWVAQDRARSAQDDERDRRSLAGDVRLRISGEDGARFSGACTVGDGERDIGGRVPQRYVFDLDGRDLACEIRKRGAESGELKVVLRGENTHFAQRIEGGDSVIMLSLEDGSVSSSTVSSGGQTSSSSLQSLSVSSSQTTGGFSAQDVDDDGESLADRIIRQVNRDIAERLEP